jgi:hypothetical protein
MKKCQCQWKEETEELQEFRSCRMENGKSRPLALALTIVDGVQCVG